MSSMYPVIVVEHKKDHQSMRKTSLSTVCHVHYAPLVVMLNCLTQYSCPHELLAVS